MTISKAWWGGFLNITGECDGRGRGHTTMGYQAKEITLAGAPKSTNARSTFPSNPR